jgi:hypothetical protein
MQQGLFSSSGTVSILANWLQAPASTGSIHFSSRREQRKVQSARRLCLGLSTPPALNTRRCPTVDLVFCWCSPGRYSQHCPRISSPVRLTQAWNFDRRVLQLLGIISPVGDCTLRIGRENRVDCPDGRSEPEGVHQRHSTVQSGLHGRVVVSSESYDADVLGPVIRRKNGG